VVKIDRSFITRLASEAEEAALACSIVRIGQAMHLATVAEGIETSNQLELLRDMGCELGQGFLFARPMPAADLEDHLCAQAEGAASEELVA
jgi:EAL domain-containing protein (putative c-di-GMP-specific phosphodiesterase class I)